METFWSIITRLMEAILGFTTSPELSVAFQTDPIFPYRLGRKRSATAWNELDKLKDILRRVAC